MKDTALVLSRMSNVIVVRTFEHEKLERFAANAAAPISAFVKAPWHRDSR